MNVIPIITAFTSDWHLPHTRYCLNHVPINRTYVVARQAEGLEGEYPPRIFLFRYGRATLSPDSTGKRDLRGRQAAPEHPPRESCQLTRVTWSPAGYPLGVGGLEGECPPRTSIFRLCERLRR